MEPRPVTAELVEQLEAPLEEFGVARVEALAELPGNPLELRIERFGSVVAPAARAVPDLDFVNRISGLTQADAGRLPEILSFYRDLGLRPWLEVAPGVKLELPAGALLGYQSVLFGQPRALEPALPVHQTDDVAGTARLLLEAFGAPPEAVEGGGDALAQATAKTGGRMYVVELEGRPVACGISTIRNRTAYLAMAGTLPEFRSRGCHAALIAARVAGAAAAGCELIVATAAFPSQSQRGLERAGVRIAYTKAVWRLS